MQKLGNTNEKDESSDDLGLLEERPSIAKLKNLVPQLKMLEKQIQTEWTLPTKVDINQDGSILGKRPKIISSGSVFILNRDAIEKETN